MEKWKDIEGFDGYQASTLGRIRSLDRKVPQVNRKPRTCKGTLLKPRPQNGGYLILSIYKSKEGGGRIRFVKTVHTLIAKTFIPNPDNKPTVNHINKNKEDNRVVNLEWATFSEQNTHSNSVGSKRKYTRTSGVREFSDNQIRDIRSRNASGESQTSISKSLRVSRRCIGNIVNRKTYKDVD